MVEITEIRDGERLLRRVLDREDWVRVEDGIGYDLLNGRPRMLQPGLQFESDGPSVYRRDILREEHGPSDAKKRPTDYVFEFSVDLIRNSDGFDVLHNPQCEETDIIGYAHSLIIYKKMPMSQSDKTCKAAFSAMRLKIMTNSEAVARPSAIAS